MSGPPLLRRSSRAFAVDPTVRFALGALAVMAVSGAFAAAAPAQNLWPGAALAAATALDATSRLAAHAAARRTGLDVALSALPSVVAAIERGPAVGALAMAAALVVPSAFAWLASGLAGLVAMGALARLALAYAVLATREPG